jgi:hypothetical protein
MHASDDAMIRRPSPHRLTLGCDGARPLVVISTASRDCCKEKQCDGYNQNTHSSLRLKKERKQRTSCKEPAGCRQKVVCHGIVVTSCVFFCVWIVSKGRVDHHSHHRGPMSNRVAQGPGPRRWSWGHMMRHIGGRKLHSAPISIASACIAKRKAEASLTFFAGSTNIFFVFLNTYHT